MAFSIGLEFGIDIAQQTIYIQATVSFLMFSEVFSSCSAIKIILFILWQLIRSVVLDKCTTLQMSS